MFKNLHFHIVRHTPLAPKTHSRLIYSLNFFFFPSTLARLCWSLMFFMLYYSLFSVVPERKLNLNKKKPRVFQRKLTVFMMFKN